MTWGDYVRAAEDILSSPRVPSSLEVITLIKNVNPTALTLSDLDRERGYLLKGKLQSLLLEHYGDSFNLVPHPASPNIILIKHRSYLSIDACHAELASLSRKAIEMVETAAPLHLQKEAPKRSREIARRKRDSALSPKEVLKKAQALLAEYDFAAAEEVLAGLRANGSGDLQVLARGAGILLQEMGAYQRCIDTLVNQPRSVLKDGGIREMLAVAYHHNGSFPEARAIFDELHPAELSPEALSAYADIAFKDGNLSAAFELAKMARGKGPFTSGLDSVQEEIETVMAAQAAPLVEMAQAALASAAFEDAGRFARQALDLYPNCQTARDLIATVDSINDETQLAELWARLESAESGERRLALLACLLERDKEQRDRIKMLLAEEKERQRRLLFGEQLESLRSLVLQERWPECFDAVLFLSRQPDFRARAGEVISLSPFFSLLLENKRLHGTIDRSVKDLWLRFLKVTTSLAAGKEEGCLDILENLKPWFYSCPEFKEAYCALLQGEQEKARKEIDGLLRQGEAECRATEVRRIYGCLRKRMLLLPCAERRELVRTMEQRLAQLIPEQDPGEPLAEYREALQIGNSEKVAYLRQEIADTAAIKAIDAEFAQAFHIASEPVALEISDDLPIDLTTPPPLQIYYETDQQFLFKDGEDTLVMIDFASKSACRMTSPVFANTHFKDYFGGDGFLFLERGDPEYGESLWRAELSVERAAFTAHFDMREWFQVEDGFSIEGVIASSERDTDYYVCIKHDEGRLPAKVLRKRVAPKATVESFQGKMTQLNFRRWTSCPDRFLVCCEKKIRHLNRNLSWRGSLSVPHGPNLYRVDPLRGHVYGLEYCLLTKRGFNLEYISSYESAPSFGLYEPGRVHGLSIETETALLVHGDGQQSFYNLRNNKFSSKIRVGRVIANQGKWYSFDYQREQGKLWLRDITHEIHSLLEWREFFLPKEKRKKMGKRMLWFHDAQNFVFKPEEWETR